MAQQLNLYDPKRRKPRPPMGSAHLGWALLGALGLGLVASLTLNGLTVRERGLTRDDETALNALNRSATGAQVPGERLAELERWRALEAGRRQVQQVMAQNRPAAAEAGASAGHGAAYFDALARQAQSALWLTGFSVSADGRQIELAGRMLNAAALPAYLRSLNDEPLFRGRPFAQLEIKGAGSGEAAPDSAGFVEFALRSQPGREEPRK